MPAMGDAITVEGWVRTKRDSKGVTFFELNDGSTIKNLQIVIDESMPGAVPAPRDLTTGSSVIVKGKLITSPAQGQAVELKAESGRGDRHGAGRRIRPSEKEALLRISAGNRAPPAAYQFISAPLRACGAP